MTVDPESRINDDWTVGKLLEEFEGHDFLPTDPEADYFVCDFCSEEVSYEDEPRVVSYVTDNVLNTDHPKWAGATSSGLRPVVPLATYCPECSTDTLLFPCKGYAELHVAFDLDPDKVMRNVEVTDFSPRDDGIPWEPRDLSESITGVSFEENRLMAAMLGREDLWGPENMVTFFLAIGKGVDIAELVKWDGSLDPKTLGRARKTYEKFQQKMASHGHSRKAFRDHVRGDDDGR